MAGWIVVWLPSDQRLERSRWQRTLTAAGRYGEHVQTVVADRVGLAAWRRARGEFPHSGTLLNPDEGSTVAWLGQCLDDAGDASSSAARLLAQRTPDDSAVARLNGAFAAAVLHENPRRITVWTDRHRHYPVYVHHSEHVSVASTELRCLVPWLATPAINLETADLLLRTGECIERTTLLADVELLSAGTCLCAENGRHAERRYWDLRFKPDQSLSLGTCAAELGRRMSTAVRRVEAASPRLGITLSGGLDSRLLLGLCERPERVPSFTWGLPGCRDIQCAAAFANAVSAPHQVRHWDPSAFVRLWPLGVERTAGGFGVHEMFMLPFVDLLAANCDVILNGLAGDALLGGNFLKWSWLNGIDRDTLARGTWRWRVTPEQDDWTSRLMRGRVAPGGSRERWTRSVRQQADARPVEDLQVWLFENRVFRFTNCGTLLLRGGVESHSPFFDRDVIDFAARVPLEYKTRHRLYIELLRRACPVAARVRWQRTGIPPAWGYWPALSALAFHRGARKLLRPLNIEPFARLAVASPAEWFRCQWRAETERILLGEQTLERGLFDPDTVRELWQTHQRGAELTRQLGVLVAVELLARQVIDGDTPTAGTADE